MKTFTKQRNFSLIVFSTLSGFLVANVFGTFLTLLRSCLVWDGFIIIGLLLLVETTNLIVYRIFKPSLLRSIEGPRTQGTPQRPQKEFRAEGSFSGIKDLEGQDPSKGRSRMISSKTLKPLIFLFDRRSFLLCQLVNSFKLGLLLGFFVEAFKVGS